MNEEWVAVLAFALLVGGAGLTGVWLMARQEAWARRHTGELITFASGVLVAGSLLHLLRRAEALAGMRSASLWALAAFVVLYVAENHFLPHPHSRVEAEGHGHHRATSGPAAVLGLGLHSVLDGIAVGAGFSTGLVTGGVMVALVVSHKLPVGIASMGALYHGGVARDRAIRYSSLVALLTPLFVILTFATLRDASEGLLGAVVAAAAGSFLYVGAADLLPEGQATGSGRNTLLFLLGVAVMVVALVLRLEVH